MIKSLTQEEYEQKVYERNPNIKILGKYKNMSAPMLYSCKVHGIPNKLPPSGRLLSHGCPKCAGNYQLTHDEFCEEIRKRFSNIVITSPFQGKKRIIEYVCTSCNKADRKAAGELLKSKGCRYCNDGRSYPEKYMIAVLNQLNVPYVYQAGKPVLSWAKRSRYDFLVRDSIIIETHGGQHYFSGGYATQSLKDITLNDIAKKKMAIANGISEDKYIIIDCRYSESGWIKKKILESSLSLFFNLSEINWDECNHYALSSLVLAVCQEWNKGNHSTFAISRKMGISLTSIERYLKAGTQEGWCNYKPEESKKIKLINTETKQVHNSLKECAETYGLKISTVRYWAYGKRKTLLRHPDTQRPLMLSTLSDYRAGNHRKAMDCRNERRIAKGVICLNTREEFASKTIAAKYGNTDSYSITRNIKGSIFSAGHHPETGEVLYWTTVADKVNGTALTYKQAKARRDNSSASKSVVAIDNKSGIIIQSFSSMRQAAKWAGISMTKMYNCLCANMVLQNSILFRFGKDINEEAVKVKI